MAMPVGGGWTRRVRRAAAVAVLACGVAIAVPAPPPSRAQPATAGRRPAAVPAAAHRAPATSPPVDPASGRGPDGGVASRGVVAPVAGAELRPAAARRPDDEHGARSAGIARRRGAFTLAVTGDVLAHVEVQDAARRRAGGFDFHPLLAGIRGPIADADLALCHLEVPLTRDLAALAGYPAFNAPWQLAPALADTGYDGCSVASNHAWDRGAEGVRATLDILDAAGLGHAGTARTRAEGRRPAWYRAGGARIAHLSATYGVNGGGPPAGRRWMVDVIDPAALVRTARRARRAGADVVVASLHWGQQYRRAPTGAQRRLAGRLLASGAVDAIVGHHAHVVQPVARRDGGVVVYGLGNLLSNQGTGCCDVARRDGVVVRLAFRERADGTWRPAGVDHLPTIVRHPQRRVVLVERELRRTPPGRWRRMLRASAVRTRRALGVAAPPAG